MSTRAHPAQSLIWLLLDTTRNSRGNVYPMPVPGHSLNAAVLDLDWARVIRQRFRFTVDEASMTFWKPSPPLLSNTIGINWVAEHSNVEDFCGRFQAVDTVSEALEASKYVHLVIVVSELVQERELVEVPEGRDSPDELPLRAIYRHFREARAPLPVSPSTAATSREYAKLQKSLKTVTYDGFYAEKRGRQPIITIAPPIQIFHPVFQEFSDRIDSPTFKPDEVDLSFVSELMPLVSKIPPSEENALKKLLPLLGRLLGRHVGSVISTRKRTPDGMVLKTIDDHIVPLLTIEYKRAFGEGGCDPSTQASFSVREFLASDQVKPLFEKCSCPSLLLAGGGAYLSILGVVFTDKFIVQRLTDIKWIGQATTQEDTRVDHLTRVFASLRIAVTTLDTYYDQISQAPDIPDLGPALDSVKPHPRFFPYPTKFQEYHPEPGPTSEAGDDVTPAYTEFEYTEPFSKAPTNITFLVRVKSTNQNLVVKFVDRYGVGAHELLADAGMAPRLLYCGLLDGKNDTRNAGSCAEGRVNDSGLYIGPTRMVVMEYIEGTTAAKSPHWPNDAREQVKEALQKLHAAQFVHGDLRGPNVIFSGGKAFLIDFDWAGRVNEARYPRNLSGSVKWPRAAEELEMMPILMDHDRFMLDQLFTE